MASAETRAPGATIRSIGPVMQIAFVPEDFDAALAHWTQVMGVGPFFWIEGPGLEDVRFKGAPAEAAFSVALGYWGDLQVELIKPKTDAPSIYTSAPWAKTGAAANGLHHVCILTDDIAGARATAEAAGAEMVMTANVPGGGSVFYADTGGAGVVVEVLQASPGGEAFFDMMKQAAIGWDGTDPLRTLG